MPIFRKTLNNSGFGHVEAIVIALVVLVICSVGYFVYKGSVAHAGSWTTMSLQSADPSIPMTQLSGISAVACQAMVNSNYLVSIEVTDTNSDIPIIIYQTLSPTTATGTNTSNYSVSSTNSRNSSKGGITQDINLSIAKGDYLALDVAKSVGASDSGYFFNQVQEPVSGSVSSTSKTTISRNIDPAQLSACPAASAVSAATSPPTSNSSTASSAQPTPSQLATPSTSNQTYNAANQGSLTSENPYSTSDTTNGSQTSQTSDTSGSSTDLAASSTAITNQSANSVQYTQHQQTKPQNFVKQKTASTSKPRASIWNSIVSFFKQVF
jgi:hypothetical protein